MRLQQPHLYRKLLSETELFDDCAVTVDVLLLEIAEKVSSVTDHLKKTASGVMVVVVSAEMFGKGVDARCKDRDLYFGRTCIAFVCAVLFDDTLLFVFLHHGLFPPFKNKCRNSCPSTRRRVCEDLLNRRPTAVQSTKKAACGKALSTTPCSRTHTRRVKYNIKQSKSKHFFEIFLHFFKNFSSQVHFTPAILQIIAKKMPKKLEEIAFIW